MRYLQLGPIEIPLLRNEQPDLNALNESDSELFDGGAIARHVFRIMGSDGKNYLVKTYPSDPFDRFWIDPKAYSIRDELNLGETVLQKRYFEATRGHLVYRAFNFVAGRDLLDHVHKNTLTGAQKVQISDELMAGLFSMLSERTVVHRDLKPPNLISNGSNCFIADIDIMERTGEKYQPVGTYPYIAPELYGNGNMTGREDVFSAGICVFILFGLPDVYRFRDINPSDSNIRVLLDQHPDQASEIMKRLRFARAASSLEPEARPFTLEEARQVMAKPNLEGV